MGKFVDFTVGAGRRWFKGLLNTSLISGAIGAIGGGALGLFLLGAIFPPAAIGLGIAGLIVGGLTGIGLSGGVALFSPFGHLAGGLMAGSGGLREVQKGETQRLAVRGQEAANVQVQLAQAQETQQALLSAKEQMITQRMGQNQVYDPNNPTHNAAAYPDMYREDHVQRLLQGSKPQQQEASPIPAGYGRG